MGIAFKKTREIEAGDQFLVDGCIVEAVRSTKASHCLLRVVNNDQYESPRPHQNFRKVGSIFEESTSYLRRL